MPANTEVLRAYLDRYGVALCGGWCSGNLMVASVAEEKEAIRQQVALNWQQPKSFRTCLLAPLHALTARNSPQDHALHQSVQFAKRGQSYRRC